jgi:predicted alpha/beta superfamily hydrolase
MKRFTLPFLNLIALTLLFIGLQAQVTLRLTSIPLNTPENAEIFLAGSIQSWNPGDPAWKLTKGGDGIYTITIPEGTGTVQYKFTLGGWDKVEKGPNGEEIANRVFTFNGSPQTLNLTVASWAGMAISTAASNVQILSNNFDMPQLGRTRRIWLYLPPDYNSTTKAYPVIYMQDGQNLFDNATSFAGEWQVDETLNKLHTEGDYGAIVVGIDNGGAQRINEYSPWNNPQYGGGQGDAYVEFIKETLKPHIDANFRTLTEPQYTCIFGSSLGALISTYGATKFPEVFGKVGSFSPAYWFALNNLNDFILGNTANISGMRIAHVGGLTESQTMVANINTVTNNLLSKGLLNSNSNIKIDPDGAHNEAYWRREFGAAYQWLFAGTPLPVRLAGFKFISTGTCTGMLQWQTLSEQRNKGFEIEKSTDGIVYDNIGFVPGNGNSQNMQAYAYQIQLNAKQKAFYRLRQVDTDANYAYSTIISVNPCGNGTKVAISPNPAQAFFTLQNVSLQPGDVVNLSTADGRILKTWRQTITNRFDIGGMPNATYFISVNGQYVGKFLKQ